MSNDPSINAALLNLCTSLNKGSGGDGGDPPKRNLEDIQWLKEALESVEAPERQIKRILTTLQSEDTTEDMCVTALEELSDLVEDINWAVEFSLMNGHQIVLDMLQKSKLGMKSSQVRQSAAMVIAHAAQLNERVQRCFEEVQWQKVIVPLLREEEDPSALAALLHSCSCLSRQYPPNAVLFTATGGINIINTLLRGEEGISSRVNSKIIKRALFLVAYLSEAVALDSQELIHYVARQAANADEDIQMVAAQALTALAERSCGDVRIALHEEAPNCLSSWRNSYLEEDDSRRQLMQLLD